MGKGNAGRKAAMKRRWDDAKTSGQATLANETKYTPRPEEEDDDFEPGTPLPARAIPALSLPAAGAGHGQGRCSSRATRAPDGWLAARAPLSRRIPLRHCRARRGVALPFPRPQLSPNPCPAARRQTTRRTGSLPGLRSALPIALSQALDELPADMRDGTDCELPVSPIFKQRRWARISWQYMAEYRKRLDCNEAVRAVAAQRSSRHRDMNDARARPAEAAMAAYAGF